MLKINGWYTDDFGRTILLTNIRETLSGERFPFEGLVMKFGTSLPEHNHPIQQLESWRMELLGERTLTPISESKAARLQTQFDQRLAELVAEWEKEERERKRKRR